MKKCLPLFFIAILLLVAGCKENTPVPNHIELISPTASELERKIYKVSDSVKIIYRYNRENEAILFSEARFMVIYQYEAEVISQVFRSTYYDQIAGKQQFELKGWLPGGDTLGVDTIVRPYLEIKVVTSSRSEIKEFPIGGITIQ